VGGGAPGHVARAIAKGAIAMTGNPNVAGVDIAALDAAVGKVRAALPSWVALPVEEKAGLVHRLRRRFGDEAPRMVEAWRQAQGLEPDFPRVVPCVTLPRAIHRF